MITREVKERNREIALMLGFKYIKTKDSYTIDKVKDDDFVFRNTSIEYSTYTYNERLYRNIYYIHTNILSFHCSWGWLMEAVEFIEKQQYNVEIRLNDCHVQSNDGEYSESSNYMINCSYDKVTTASSKKEAVFIAISDFAKLYNEKTL